MTRSARPALDAEFAAILAEMRAGGTFTTLTSDLIEELRSFQHQINTEIDLELREAFHVRRVTVQGPPDNPHLSLIICRPNKARKPTPTLYYIHGGGMVAGDARGVPPSLIECARELGIGIVSVDYRLAPEHPDPAPLEDCYAGLVRTAEHGAEFGIDVSALIMCGASAGGGLAAGTALLTRDRGGPALLGQLLVSPMLDDRMQTVSSQMWHGDGLWDGPSNMTGWAALLGARAGGSEVSIYAAPARADDLRGLPPTFLEAAEVDTLRDEVVAFASQIWTSGGSAELHVWPGACHGFDALAPHAPVSKSAVAARADWLRRLLNR